MDLELKQFGQTLAIGGLLVYSLQYIFRVLAIPKSIIPRFLSAEEGKGEETPRDSIQKAAISFALILACGIVAEDISKEFSAGRAEKNLSCVFDYFIDRDSELRTRSLYEIDSKKKNSP